MVPSAFAALVDSFLKEEYEDSPTLASSLGLTEYDERLDDTSAAAYERRRASDLEWLRKFRAVTDDGLAPVQRIDRDLLVSVLRGRELYQPLDMWKRQPNYYLNPGLNGVFSLFLYRLRPERELADAARLRRARHRPGEGGRALRARARAGRSERPGVERPFESGRREGREGLR